MSTAGLSAKGMGSRRCGSYTRKRRHPNHKRQSAGLWGRIGARRDLRQLRILGAGRALFFVSWRRDRGERTIRHRPWGCGNQISATCCFATSTEVSFSRQRYSSVQCLHNAKARFHPVRDGRGQIRSRDRLPEQVWNSCSKRSRQTWRDVSSYECAHCRAS